jgi:hypothetical protein
MLFEAYVSSPEQQMLADHYCRLWDVLAVFKVELHKIGGGKK